MSSKEKAGSGTTTVTSHTEPKYAWISFDVKPTDKESEAINAFMFVFGLVTESEWTQAKGIWSRFYSRSNTHDHS